MRTKIKYKNIYKVTIYISEKTTYAKYFKIPIKNAVNGYPC